jgi:hypothetical protein
MKRLMTIDEAVAFLGGILSRRTVARRCSDGTFPSRKVGNRWLVSGEGLAEAVGLAVDSDEAS